MYVCIWKECSCLVCVLVSLQHTKNALSSSYHPFHLLLCNSIFQPASSVFTFTSVIQLYFRRHISIQPLNVDAFYNYSHCSHYLHWHDHVSWAISFYPTVGWDIVITLNVCPVLYAVPMDSLQWADKRKAFFVMFSSHVPYWIVRNFRHCDMGVLL